MRLTGEEPFSRGNHQCKGPEAGVLGEEPGDLGWRQQRRKRKEWPEAGPSQTLGFLLRETQLLKGLD